LKESKAKDQTGKGAKIKGSNNNFSGGLITKLQNGVVSLNTIDCLLQMTLRATGRETFVATMALICFNQGGMFHS